MKLCNAGLLFLVVTIIDLTGTALLLLFFGVSRFQYALLAVPPAVALWVEPEVKPISRWTAALVVGALAALRYWDDYLSGLVHFWSLIVAVIFILFSNRRNNPVIGTRVAVGLLLLWCGEPSLHWLWAPHA